MRLIAEKNMRYSTRRLLPGDEFEASRRDGRVLVAIGRARLAPPEADAATAGADEVAEMSASTPVPDGIIPVIEENLEDIADLRVAYQERFGKRPFMGWDADALRAKIAEG